MKQFSILLAALLFIQGCSNTDVSQQDHTASSEISKNDDKSLEIREIVTLSYELFELPDFNFFILLPKDTFRHGDYQGYDLESTWPDGNQIVSPSEKFAFNIYNFYQPTTKETLLTDYCIINKYNETYKERAELLGSIKTDKIEIMKVQPTCEEYPIYFFWYKQKPYVINPDPTTTEQGHQIILNALMHIQDM
jgi:hypothetical protein